MVRGHEGTSDPFDELLPAIYELDVCIVKILPPSPFSFLRVTNNSANHSFPRNLQVAWLPCCLERQGESSPA
jgi:hypothetical protein